MKKRKQKVPKELRELRRRNLKEIRDRAKLVTQQTGVQHNVHHRRPICLSGTDAENNLSIVPMRQHDAFHLIFTDTSPEAIARVLSKVWIDPDYELVARKKFIVT